MIKLSPEKILLKIKQTLSEKNGKLSDEELIIKTLIYNYENNNKDYIDVETIFDGRTETFNHIDL